MSMASFWTVVLLLLVARLTVGRELLQVSLLHRHGARTEPVVTGDEHLSWTNCVLSDTGVLMALSLGRFTRERYSTLLPPQYDERIIVSVSTDFERTIRTGVGCLIGMYENDTNTIPYLAHAPQDLDFLLSYYYSWPSAVLAGEYINSYNAANNADTKQYFPQDKLDVIGIELNVPTLCSENQTTCALFGEDVTTCRLSNGGLTSNLSSLLPYMFEAQEKSNAFLYLYNRSNQYWRNTGPYGRLLAVEIGKNYNTTLSAYQSGAVIPDVKMYHYSAHDVTIYSFFVAIGVISNGITQEDILVPTFASAVFMELYSDGNISVNFFECNQTFGSNYDFAVISNVYLGCKPTPASSIYDLDGIYFATECPLQHYQNFLDTMLPQSLNATNGAPWCYRGPEFMVETGCFPNATSLPTPDCLLYRTICPDVSCDSDAGFVLNRVTYQCVQLNPPSQDSSHPGVIAYILVPLCSLLLGVVIGVSIRCAVFERKSKQEAEVAPLLDENSRSGVVQGSAAVLE